MADPLRDAAQALLDAVGRVNGLRVHVLAEANALRAALAAADTAPAELIDGIPEDLHTDIESEIHQHCGHDGQSDEANDWVTDLMSALSPLISRALAAADGTAPTQPDDIHRGVTLQDIEGDVMTSAIAVPFAPGTLVEVRRVVATPATETPSKESE